MRGVYIHPHICLYGGHMTDLLTEADRNNQSHLQSPVEKVPGCLSPKVKRPDHKADRSPPSNAEVKNEWNYTSIPICLHGVMLGYKQGP
jgi:hypothetical protein